MSDNNNNNINDILEQKPKEYYIDRYLPDGFPRNIYASSILQEINLDWILREMKKYRYIYYRLETIIRDLISEELENLVYEKVLVLLGFINAKNPPSPLVAMKGDSNTDDTPALKAIFEYMSANNKCLLYLPSGNYRLNSFTIPAGITIVGECQNDTVLFANPYQTVDMIRGELTNVKIANLTLAVNMQAQTNYISGVGAKVNNVDIINVSVNDGYYGLNLTENGGYCHVDNVGIYRPYYAHVLVNGYNPGGVITLADDEQPETDFSFDHMYFGEMAGNLEKGPAFNVVNKDGVIAQSVFTECEKADKLLTTTGSYGWFHFIPSQPAVKTYTNSGQKNNITLQGYSNEIDIDFWQGKIINVDNFINTFTQTGESATTVIDNVTHTGKTISVTTDDISTTAKNRTESISESLYLDTVNPIKYSETHDAGKYFNAVTWQDKTGNNYDVLVNKDSASKIANDIAAVQAGSDALAERVTTAEAGITENKTNITELTGRVEKNETDISQINTEIVEINDQLANHTQTLTQHEQTLTQHTSEISDIMANVSAAEADITKNKDDIAAIHTSISNINSTTADLRTDVDTNKQAISDLQGAVSGDFSSLRADIDKNTATIEKEVTDRTTAVQAETTAREAADEGLKTDIATAESNANAYTDAEIQKLEQANNFIRYFNLASFTITKTLNAGGYVYESYPVSGAPNRIIAAGFDPKNFHFRVTSYRVDYSGIYWGIENTWPSGSHTYTVTFYYQIPIYNNTRIARIADPKPNALDIGYMIANNYNGAYLDENGIIHYTPEIDSFEITRNI